MKRFYYVGLALAFLSMAAFGEGFAKQGVVELGGNIGFTSITGVANGETADKSTTLLNISPSVGYFVIDGLELGICPLELGNLSIAGANGFQSMSSGGESVSMLGLWGFGAYHFAATETVFPFLEATAGYTSMSSGGESIGGLSFGFGGGAKISIASSLLMNIGLTYKFYTYKPEGAEKRFGFNILAVGLGFSGFLGGK